MTAVNPSSGNETKSDIFSWDIFLSDIIFHWSQNTKTFQFITRVRGQYRYSWYLREVIGWKLRHSRQYSPVLPAAIATAELFKYVSIKCKQTQKNFRKIYYTLWNSVFIFRLPKTWMHYSEDITGRWRDEDIPVPSFSLYYTWLNNTVGLVFTCVRFYILFLPI